MTAIHLNNVRKSFGTFDVIKGVDLEISPSEFMVFVGPSGCAAPPTLRMLAFSGTSSVAAVWFVSTLLNTLSPFPRRCPYL